MAFCVGVERLGRGPLKIAAGLGAFMVLYAAITPAEANSKGKKAPAYSPPYASIVVDANTGKVLFGKNENALRHPASITKVMTLYMLFEQMERGKIRPDSRIRVSANAARQPPTKIGLRAGSTISVDNAIKSLVTKSANDIAVAIAEHLGGSEEEFARQMTAKARSIGMSRTTFTNASGLPNPKQVTTARDLTILGRSIQERFPKQYAYFALPGFQFSGSTIRNHNKLLGRIEGVDGIKTGYTRASGFNLLTSAKRDNRRIVAVVLGGRSGGHRDNIMANLVEEHIDRGARSRSAPMIAETNAPSNASLERAIQTAEARAPVAVAVAAPAPAVPAPAPAPVARAPEAAQTRVVEQAPRENMLPPMQLAAYAPDERARPAVISGAARNDGSTTASIRSSTPSSSNGATPTMRWVSGPRGIVSSQPSSMLHASGGGLLPPAPIPTVEPTRIASTAPNMLSLPPQQSVQPREPDNSPQRPAFARTGVMIQVGATDDQDKANALLARARTQGKGSLASAQPFTEKVTRGSDTLWRARFAGLDETRAKAACKTLKRSGMACFTTRN
jgi:D-alanyl-D-alanine carboxypeptidase